MAERIPSLGTPEQPMRPTSGGYDPVLQVLPPLAERPLPGAEQPETLLEASQDEQQMMELLEGFREEIQASRDFYAKKKRTVFKAQKYLSGEDIEEPDPEYTESTFFYRRLPRLCSVAKTKILKHVCPLDGRPWHLEPSAVSEADNMQDRSERLRKLRLEFDDIHEANDLDSMLDDLCARAVASGTEVIYGPVRLSNPRLRWQGGVEQVVEADAYKPMWRSYSMLDVFPDPRSFKVEGLQYCYFRDVLSPHQLRSLEEDDSFNQQAIADLLDDNPDGNWQEEQEEWETLPSKADYFVTWMRVGYLDADALELLQAQKIIKIPKRGAKRTMLDSLWEIWFCGDQIIKASMRKFQPKKMPVYFVPFFRDVYSIFGIGPIEAALDVQEMMINICRAIDDDLADTSGYQAVIDSAAVLNKSLDVHGRKTWLTRRKGNDGGNHRPVEFFTVPSNLQHLIAALQLFEQMIPIVSGVPEMVTGQDMGSGVRTNLMHNDIWSALEDFLKDVVGSVDRFFWKPFLRDTYHWVMKYAPNRLELEVDAMIHVTGVKGALKREITARKVQEFYISLKQNGEEDWMDEIEALQAITEGLGLDSSKAVLSPEKYVERQSLKLQQLMLQKQAEQAPEAKERAHMSVRDVILQGYKTTPQNNPLWLSFAEQLFEISGEANERVYASLQIWARTLATYYQRMGLATPEEAGLLAAPFKAESPLELEPGFRDEAAAKQADQMKGQTPMPGPDPVPAMPNVDPAQLASIINQQAGMPGGAGPAIQPGSAGPIDLSRGDA